MAIFLKAWYYPWGNILGTDPGQRPSFSWRSLWEAIKVVWKGSQWLIGNEVSVDVWADRWILRPSTFKIGSPKQAHTQNLQGRDLIDAELGCWREAFVQETFLPCDVELTLGMPLCTFWPEDKLLWHYSPKGLFTVSSTYHAIVSEWNCEHGSSWVLMVIHGTGYGNRTFLHESVYLARELAKGSSPLDAILQNDYLRLGCHVTFTGVEKNLIFTVFWSAL